MTDRTDPEYRMSNDEKIMTATSQFERGAMTEPVFRASVFAAGLRGAAIETLVRLHRPFRSLAEISAPVVGFVSGLP